VPSNQSPLGALPARFRRPRLLIVGCGDVGLRVLKGMPSRSVRAVAITSQSSRMPELRQAGATPVLANLDAPHTLQRLAGWATHVLHLAPPPGEGAADPRTQALVRTLMRRSPPQALVYGSTTGVYGDCEGAWVSESRPVAPHTPRAKRRVHAEGSVRFLNRACGPRSTVLRIPGIYAADRAGGPQERLAKGSPVLRGPDDVFTNHIHANDLARACWLALWRGKPQRTLNITDDTQLKMGDYFDAAADHFGLPRPERIARADAASRLGAMQLSFMGESRRLLNTRMKRELRLALRYPTVQDAWAAQIS
jgi:nucleoside-diphosphate-sugar epimerase